MPKRAKDGKFLDKCPRCMAKLYGRDTYKRERKTKKGERRDVVSTYTVTRVCEHCGGKFSQGNIGRPARWCERCRRLPPSKRRSDG